MDNFRAQLKKRQQAEETMDIAAEASRADPTKASKVRKEKKLSSGRVNVWVSKEAAKTAKRLAFWLEEENDGKPVTIGALFSAAIECLVETKYPKAKRFIQKR